MYPRTPYDFSLIPPHKEKACEEENVTYTSVEVDSKDDSRWSKIKKHLSEFLRLHREGFEWLIFLVGIKPLMSLVIPYLTITYGEMSEFGKAILYMIHYGSCIICPACGGILLMVYIAEFIMFSFATSE